VYKIKSFRINLNGKRPEELIRQGRRRRRRRRRRRTRRRRRSRRRRRRRRRRRSLRKKALGRYSLCNFQV
jgi:hypothetical protein